MTIKGFLACLLVIATMVSMYLVDQADSNSKDTHFEINNPLVKETTSGILLGQDLQAYYQWLGIPYAETTAGEHRWRAPRPYKGKGFLYAHNFGQQCAQPEMEMENHTLIDMHYAGSEDCLFLNLWVPKTKSWGGNRVSPLPVIVWIHGGANVVGNGNIQGGKLAASQQVIVASLNYRLGTFGWLSHRSFRNSADTLEDASGNFGSLDIIESLKWLKSNIRQFGGDPENVTVMGLSAGGWNIFSLLHSPIAKGLFHKAIIHSGKPITTTLSVAENYFDDETPGHVQSSGELLVRLLLDDGLASSRDSAKFLIEVMPYQKIVSYLRKKTHSQIEYALAKLVRNDQSERSIFRRSNTETPRLNHQAPKLFEDGAVISNQDFLRSVEYGAFNSVPVILGSTKDESKNFQALDTEYIELIDGKRVIKSPKRYETANIYLSKLWKILGVDQPAKAIAATAPVFAFRFDWDALPENEAGENLKALYGASHGIDQAFIFGDKKSPFSERKFTKPDKELSETMMSYWAEFAYTGQPGKGRDNNLPQWLPWSTEYDDQKITLILNRPDQGGIWLLAGELNRKSLIADIHDKANQMGLEERKLFFKDLRDAAIVNYKFSLENATLVSEEK